MDSIPGENQAIDIDKTLGPFSVRMEHSLLPEDFEGKAPKGPYTLEKFTFRDIPYHDRSSDWQPPYWDELRQIALSYWMGSEFEVALIRRDINLDSSDPTTMILHVYDQRTDKTINLVCGGEWDDINCWHYVETQTNYIQLISFLLTFYNGIIFDDNVDKVSRIYFQNPLSRPIGDTLKINRGVGGKVVFKKEDHWTAKLDKFYSKSVKRKKGKYI